MGDRLREWGLEMVDWSIGAMSEMTFGLFKTIASAISGFSGSISITIYTLAIIFLFIKIGIDGTERLGGRKDPLNAVYKYIIEAPNIIWHMALIPSMWTFVIFTGNYFNQEIKNALNIDIFLKSCGEKINQSLPDTFFLGGLFVLCSGIVLLLLGGMSILVYYEVLYLFIIGPVVIVRGYDDNSKIPHYYAEILFRLLHPAIYLLGLKIVLYSLTLMSTNVAGLAMLFGLISVLMLPHFIRPFILNGVGGGSNIDGLGRFASLAKLAI